MEINEAGRALSKILQTRSRIGSLSGESSRAWGCFGLLLTEWSIARDLAAAPSGKIEEEGDL